MEESRKKVIVDLKITPLEKRRHYKNSWPNLPMEGEIIVEVEGKVIEVIDWAGLGKFPEKSDRLIKNLEREKLEIVRSKNFMEQGKEIAKGDFEWSKSGLSGSITTSGSVGLYGKKIFKSNDRLNQQLAYLEMIEKFCNEKEIPLNKVLNTRSISILQFKEKIKNDGSVENTEWLLRFSTLAQTEKNKLESSSKGSFCVEVPTSYIFSFDFKKLLFNRIKISVLVSRWYNTNSVKDELLLPDIERYARILGITIDQVKEIYNNI